MVGVISPALLMVGTGEQPWLSTVIGSGSGQRQVVVGNGGGQWWSMIGGGGGG